MTQNRAGAERRGRRAEALAALYLQLKGYRLIARRARVPGGEVDLVMRRRRTVVFVEVKARADAIAADAALAPERLHRVRRAAEGLWPRHATGMDGARIDAVVILPWRWPLHLKGLD